MITLHALGVTWIAASFLLASPIGRTIRGPVRAPMATVIPLFPPAGSSGEETPSRGLPARLSPRAGYGTRRFLRRARRSRAFADLRTHVWLVGLIAAGLLCIIATRGQYVAWDGVHEIPVGGAR